MSDRVSQIILLCEDDAQARLARAYMRNGKIETQVREIVASRMQRGGNVGWVLARFPPELHACRQRQKRANTLLIVIVDADRLTVDERRRELESRVKLDGYEKFGTGEPVVVLIPKRHVETWIRVLLGESVTEDDDCKTSKKLKTDDVREAARTLYAWSRPNATAGPQCVPSLLAALPEWRRIV